MRRVNEVLMFDYLDELRAAGETNMFGARVHLMEEFGLPPKYAADVLARWMKTFKYRHTETGRRKI